MTFQMIRTSVRPSVDVKFYRVPDTLLESAFLALGDRYLGRTVTEDGNTQTVTRSFVDEAAYNEAKLSLNNNPDVEQMRINRENYNRVNGITTEIITSTI